MFEISIFYLLQDLYIYIYIYTYIYDIYIYIYLFIYVYIYIRIYIYVNNMYMTVYGSKTITNGDRAEK